MNIKLIVGLVLLMVCRVDAANWFAATNGTAGGTGAIGSPWDLQTAFSKIGIVVAGDTLNIRGGVYTHIPQGTNCATCDQPGYVFLIEFNGSSGNPVIVQPYNGERVIIDGSDYQHYYAYSRPTLQVGVGVSSPTKGSYVRVKDLEIASLSNETRTSVVVNSQDLGRSDGIICGAAGDEVINCTVYDVMTGISSFGTVGSPHLYYGNLVFSTGWLGIDRPHGHGMYLQNSLAGSTKSVHTNTVLNVYENALQAYGSAAAEVFHFRIAGNLFVNNVFIHGGLTSTPQGDDQIRGNFLYNSTLLFTYLFNNSASNVEVCNNYVANGYIQGGAWTNALITNNTVLNNGFVFKLATSPFCNVVRGWTNDFNKYFVSSAPTTGKYWKDEGCADYTFAQWQAHGTNSAGVAGWEANSQVFAPLPSTNLIVLHANLYDTNRATVIAYNWSMASTIAVNLSTLGWAVTDQIRVRQNADWENDITTNSIPGQILTLPMSAASHTVAIPRGSTTSIGPETFPQFGSFSLYRIVGATPTPTNIITIASTNASGAVVTATIDINGNAGAATTFSRNYLQGTPVSFTAPATLGTNNFSHWTHAGTNYSFSTTIGFNVDSTTTYTAVYISPPSTTWAINVASVTPNSGVTITNFPADNSALLSGVTSYSLNFNDGVVFALTAPSTAGGNVFKLWRLNGVSVTTKTEVTTTANSVSLGVNPSLLEAVYDIPAASSNTVIVLSTNASAVTISAIPNDLSGAGAGVTTFSRNYSTFTSITLTAPSTASGKSFLGWIDQSGTAVSDTPGGTATTFFMNVPRTRIAVFTNSVPAPSLTNLHRASSRRRGTRF